MKKSEGEAVVTKMVLTFGPPKKRRPEVGDERVTKDGRVEVARQQMVRHFGVVCGLVRRGRPVLEWVDKEDL